MWTTLIVSFCYFAISLDAETISTDNSTTISTPTSTSNTTNSSIQLSEIDEELAKIASDCLNARDYEHITGDHVRSGYARIISGAYIEESVFTIGLEELRAALKLDPPGPWKHYNRTKPSEQELESASAVEEYYNLKKPKNHLVTLDNEFLFEHNIVTAVKFFDKRLPSIRIVFRRTYQEKLSSAPEMLDKKTIDEMFESFYSALEKVSTAMSKLSKRKSKCWDDYTENLKN